MLRTLHQILVYLIALVWLVNGLFCKVLNWVPRHQAIVGSILGDDYAFYLVKAIGVAEIFMAIWVVSRIKSRLNAITQMLIVGLMNILEFMLVPDLLLWGKWNAFFACFFIALVYYNEFVLNKTNPS